MPELNSDIYAKVFVAASFTQEELATSIAQFDDGTSRGKFFNIHTDQIDIDVKRNDFYDPEKDSFINYRYYLDVNPYAGISKDQFLKALAKLMAFLKKHGYPAVAACDWEDELARLVESEMK